jgi:proteasome lid subunit RPN8/RPN11
LSINGSFQLRIEKMTEATEFQKPKMTYDDTLRFTPYAWAKLLYMQKAGKTEVAGYCVTGTNDPFLVTDFRLVKQDCTCVTFDFDEDDMAEYQELMLDTGLAVWQSSRILGHTHPGSCPNPSEPDEKNFRKVFTRPDWAIMLIVAKDGSIYCRLKINVGPGVEKLMKVQVDFGSTFQASDHAAWQKEYKEKVTENNFVMTGREGLVGSTNVHSRQHIQIASEEDIDFWNEYIEEQDKKGSQLEEELDEIDCQPDFDCQWDYDGNVCYLNMDNNMWYFYDPIKEKWYIENDHRLGEIKPPTAPWAAEVVEWAATHAHEREEAMEV